MTRPFVSAVVPLTVRSPPTMVSAWDTSLSSYVRLTSARPGLTSTPVLRDVQHALAQEYGFENWKALRDAVNQLHPAPSSKNPEVQKYESLAKDMVAIYATGDADALQRLNQHYGRSFTAADLRATVWGAIRTVREAKGAAHAFGENEAQRMIAQAAGFGSWQAFTDAVVKGTPPPDNFYALDENASHRGVSFPRRNGMNSST